MNYSVKDVSGMIETSPETIRTWIKTGRLAASMDANRKYVINDMDLYSYLTTYRPGAHLNVLRMLRDNNPVMDRELKLLEYPRRIAKAEILLEKYRIQATNWKDTYECQKEFLETLRREYEELKGEANEQGETN